MGVLDLLPVFVLGRMEENFVLLPFAGLFAGVHGGWLCPVDGSHVTHAELSSSIAVEHLNLIFAVQVNAGVGPFRHHDFQFYAGVPVGEGGVDVQAFAVGL